MPSFKTEIPHALTTEEAKYRVTRAMESVGAQYAGTVDQLSSCWDDNLLTVGFTIYGMNIQSNLQVHEQHVAIDAKIPLIAVPLKGKIEQTLNEQLGRLLR